MAEPASPCVLRASDEAFHGAGVRWPAAHGAAPGCRTADDTRVLVVQHAARSATARSVFGQLGLPWPQEAGELHRGPGATPSWVWRRHPGELLFVGSDDAVAEALLARLPAAAEALPDDEAAVAFDLSHGMRVLVLEGQGLDAWLARMVDAASIPRQPGQGAGVRLVDVAAVLLRLEPLCVWLVADRALTPYLAEWLCFTHAATLGDERARQAAEG